MSLAEPQSPPGEDGSALVLPEPARLRLVQLASDVLGRMAAEEVPPALRPIARFTPPKRVRGELAQLRAKARTEPARIREAVAAARAETETELTELRRALRSRTAGLRAAERERDQAREALAELERRSSGASAAADAEL